ncbi:hypothetical protein VF13_24820, partial [Nostoc linckia z16]
DSRQTLVMQYVRGWLGRNRKYYEQLAKIDVAKREMDIDEWVNVVINDGFAEVKEPTATLIHEEHRAIELPQGLYRVWRQREYRPEAYVEVAD